jgi:hypothetical protein
MSKQTAVDWLYRTHFFKNGELTQSDFEQAKVMEHEQIIEAYMTAKLKHVDCLGIDVIKRKLINETKQYYNETYKGGEQ